jgi:hypothetical protein
MQIIVNVGMEPEQYVAQKGHEKVAAPVGCPNPSCGNRGRLHRNHKYGRSLSGLPYGTNFWVAGFLCGMCRLTVSCLPSFALPYRHVRVKTVESFFCGQTDDPEVERHRHILERYRNDLKVHLHLLTRCTGYFLGEKIFCQAEGFLKALVRKCGDLAEGGRQVAMQFGLGIFREYSVHAWARRSVWGVGSPKRRVRADSG